MMYSPALARMFLLAPKYLLELTQQFLLQYQHPLPLSLQLISSLYLRQCYLLLIEVCFEEHQNLLKEMSGRATPNINSNDLGTQRNSRSSTQQMIDGTATRSQSIRTRFHGSLSDDGKSSLLDSSIIEETESVVFG